MNLLFRSFCTLLLLSLLVPLALADGRTASFNRQIEVLPTPGEVIIDGRADDWDLSGGIWSYNDPTLVDLYSVWTHLMWDERGLYFLARYHDRTPMKNAAAGKDFSKSWRGDCYQARVVFDSRADDEHQMHVNMYHSSPDDEAIMIVHHGGMKAEPPYDETGPRRPDQLEKWGPTMDAAGGRVAIAEWDDGKGYSVEAFWPWSFCRTSGEPLEAGDDFVFGLEAMWGNPSADNVQHRLADGVKDDSVNRIFMFRAREGWGRAVLVDQNQVDTRAEQLALHETRLKRFQDFDTYGSVAIDYELPGERDVTIAIDDPDGVRVRNLIGQFPRDGGTQTDLWDGLDDDGNPVEPGQYQATILHHEPVEMEFFNSVYSSAIPPWTTDEGARLWGSNHGHPTSVATKDDVTVLFFTGTEGGSGIQRVDANGVIQWADGNEFIDGTIDEQYVYGLSKNMWVEQTLLFRFKVDGGQIVPFDDEQRTPSPVLLPDRDISTQSTLALAHGHLWMLAPGRTLQQIDPDTGRVVAEHPADDLAALTDRRGVLYGLYDDGRVATLDENLKPTMRFRVRGLERPARLAVDQSQQRFAISDLGQNQVHVVDAEGQLMKVMGEARQQRDRPAGAFVTSDFTQPVGVGFDAGGRIWISEGNDTCKRVSLWSDGYRLLDQFWGQADYGATAGFAHTADATRFIAHGIEFELDPDPDPTVRKTDEQPLIYHPQLAVQQRGLIYEVDGREYAVSAPGFHKAPNMSVFKRDEDGVFRACVRVSLIDNRNPPMKAWVDRDGDGNEDADEVIDDADIAFMYWSNGWVRPDMVYMTTNGHRFEPQGFSEQGVPLYDFNRPQKISNWIETVNRQGSVGSPIMDLAGNVSNGIAYHTADGRRGEYPNPYGRHNAPAAQRGLLIAPFRTNGVVEDLPGIGSMTALAGDRGEWFLMSMDGLYVSSLAQDAKGYVELDETFIGQESFGGFIWRDAETGKVLVQLGGPSFRLMEVTGLETSVRETMTLDVTRDQIREGARIAQERQQTEASEPDRLRISAVRDLPSEAPAVAQPLKRPLIGGAVDVFVSERGDASRWFRAALAHDGDELAVAFQVADPSPWQNGAGRFTHAFIGGDAVDLQLDSPKLGPIRLLVAPVEGGDTAVFWRADAETPENPTTYVVANNPGNATRFDVVRRLESATVQTNTGPTGYTVLLKVPLDELGLQPGDALTGVVGVIYSDPSGTNRAARLYWHDKETGMVSDVPTEARLHVDRWGEVAVD